MKISIDNNSNYVFVRAETGDKKTRTESQFYHHVRNVLKDRGFDVVKREMTKDGHMTSNDRYYIRERNWKWCILDDFYATKDIVAEYNRYGSYQLTKVFLTW